VAQPEPKCSFPGDVTIDVYVNDDKSKTMNTFVVNGHELMKVSL